MFLILDIRIEDGFWIATSTEYAHMGLALLSRAFDESGDLVLIFSGEADVEEYFVAWGFESGSYEAQKIEDPGEIERIAGAAHLAGIGGFVVNPPLDGRVPEDIFTPQEIRDWARNKEDA